MRYKKYGYEGSKWVCYFYLITWSHISFGLHFDLAAPNMELHLPFGFIRAGRRSKPQVVMLNMPKREAA